MHRQKQAGVAQLVERQPSKLNVASSNLVSRSFILIFAEVAQLVERQPSKLNVASSNLVFRSAKEILDVIIKDFLLYRTARLIVDMSYKLYCCRHELQTLFIVGTS